MNIKKKMQKKMNTWVKNQLSNNSENTIDKCPWPGLIYAPKKPKSEKRK